MKTYNNTDQTLAEVMTRKPVGVIKNNWRQRYVELYLSEDPEKLYMVGTTFDSSMQVISLEPISMLEVNAMAIFPKTLIRD